MWIFTIWGWLQLITRMNKRLGTLFKKHFGLGLLRERTSLLPPRSVLFLIVTFLVCFGWLMHILYCPTESFFFFPVCLFTLIAALEFRPWTCYWGLQRQSEEASVRIPGFISHSLPCSHKAYWCFPLLRILYYLISSPNRFLWWGKKDGYRSSKVYLLTKR